MEKQREHIGITDLSALTQWCNTVTKGVYSVEFVEGAETAAISGNRMILPRPNTAMTKRDMIRLRGFALHETSHPLYQREAFDILKKVNLKPESPLGGIYNMCLDVHAETSRAQEYPGDKLALSEFGAVLGRDISDSLIPKVGGIEEDSDPAKMLAVMHATLEAESQWNLGLRSGTRDLLAAMPSHVKAKAEDVTNKFDLSHRLTDPSETPHTLWELARNVYSYLYDADPDEESQKGDGSSSGEGESKEGEDGKGKGGKKGDKKGEKKGESGTPSGGGDEVDPEAKGEKGGEPEGGELSVKEMVWSSHYENKGPVGDYGHGKSMRFDDYTEHAVYTPYPEPSFVVKDYDKEKAVEHPYRLLPPADAASNSPGFVSELRRLIQVKAEAHYSQGYRSGKLSSGRLWRIGAPPIDEGRWNGTVFKRKTETSDIMDTCVSLLVDASGSMGGSKYENAYRAAAILNDTMSRVLHIPVEINTFSSYGPQPVIGNIKHFDKAVAPQELRTRFSDFIGHMAGNNDADSVSWVYNRLKTRREKRKILVVFSDGSPSDGDGDPSYALRTVVGEIEKQAIVDIYGIGICTNSVQRFYSKNDVINSADQVQRALIKVLREALK